MPAKKSAAAKSAAPKSTAAKKEPVRRRAEKAPKAVAAEPAPRNEVAEAAAVADVAAATAVNEQVAAYSSRLDALIAANEAERKAFLEASRAHEKELKALRREYTKVLTKALSRRKRRANPNSGVHKPVAISSELASFLKHPADELISRVAVNRLINSYVKEHGLQKENDKRQIVPDAALRRLLNVPADVDLTFFNMATYLKPHYVAAASA